MRGLNNEINHNTYFKLEQYCSRVLDITNRYGSPNQTSYDAGNLTGKYERYPEYGDFPETYALRQYGSWWKLSEVSYQKYYRETDVDPLGAEDFITVRFERAVVPTQLFIYETYNPGSIVRIWGREQKEKWNLMWEGETQEGPMEAVVFQPELLSVNTFIDTIRLELNCSKLSCHACFDCVLLTGFFGPRSELQMRCLQVFKNSLGAGDIKYDEPSHKTKSVISFAKLPYEVVIYIFQLLDLSSLSKCACVSSEWNKMVNDPLLYQNISFKKYWHIVDSRIFDFMARKGKGLKKLDLSWCGNDDVSFPRKFYQFLQYSCPNLTHISLGNASYFNGSHLAAICNSCPKLEELRLRNVYIMDISFCHQSTLKKLKKLITLDLYCTNVTTDFLFPLLEVNPDLKYLNLDFCDKLPLDDVIAKISVFNPNLRGLSCWKGKSLTLQGISLLGKCTNLEDLDLGWCVFVLPNDQTLETFCQGCKGLRRLVLAAWRPLVDSMLSPLLDHCTKLEQLDISSIVGISPEFIENALNRLQNLRFLDLSYCRPVPLEYWRASYPKVTIVKCNV